MNNKHALVCGSSKGIGASTAIELSKLGATITLLARDKDSLANVLDSLDTSKKQNHNFIIADFDDPFKLKDTIDQHIAKKPTIHILINNSGGPKPGPIVDANVEDFISAFNRHLICNHILVQAVVPKMKEARFGRIINITSTSVKQPIKGLGISNTIRGAVANWAKTLSFELGEFGITVNNILPGFTMTERLRSLINNTAKTQKIDPEQIEENYLNIIPSKRFGEPEEIAYLVTFLSSKKASYINGINLPVDGGFLSNL